MPDTGGPIGGRVSYVAGALPERRANESGERLLGIRTVRWLTAAYMAAFFIAVTWPGFLLFNRVTPIVFGLPFNLFAIALFITFAMVVLFLLYRSEQRRDDEQT